MSKPLTDEDLQVRAAIDGRAAFATAALAVAGVLVALLDRVGAPPRLVAVLGPAVALAGLSAIGVLLRDMRISRFYAAGRVVPASYAGFAFAALAAGLFAPFLPPARGGPSSELVLWSFAGGVACAGLIVGPLLRRTGAFSVPDLIANRFPNLALRFGVVAVIGAVGLLVAIAGFATAATALSEGMGLSSRLAGALIGVVVCFVLAPGGVGGLVWASAGAAGILLAGLALPLAIVWIGGEAPPLPVIGDVTAWAAALRRFGEWNIGAASSEPAGPAVVLAIVLGIGSLAPLLTPATSTSGGKAARGAGLAGFLWCVAFAALAAATLALSALAIDSATRGLRPESLSPSILSASGAGLLEICGGHPGGAAAARALCAARPNFSGILNSSDIVASGGFLLLALPALRGLGGALSGLAVAGVIAIGTAISAAGVQTFATAFGHDLFYRVRDATAMTSRRLAVTRALIIGAVALVAAVLAPLAPDPRQMTGLAILFGAATVMPLLALSIWPRAEGGDAAAALLAGLAAIEAYIFFNGGVGSLDSAGRAAVFSCAVSTLTGVAASFLHPADPAGRGGVFALGILRGAEDMLDTDKGA